MFTANICRQLSNRIKCSTVRFGQLATWSETNHKHAGLFAYSLKKSRNSDNGEERASEKVTQV